MAGYDPSQPRDELGRWTEGTSVKIGAGKHKGKSGIITEISPSGKYYTVSSTHGSDRKLGYYHESDLTSVEEQKKIVEAARKGAGLSAYDQVKKTKIKPVPKGGWGTIDRSTKFNQQETDATVSDLMAQGWKKLSSHPYHTQFFWDAGGIMLEKDGVYVEMFPLGPSKEKWKAFWFDKQQE